MSKKKLTEHQLYVATPSLWRKLKKANTIDEIYRKKARKISIFSTILSPFQWLQKILFHKKVVKIRLEEISPIFILGHWRSGTTHLHYLLARDPNWGYLSNYQAYLFNMVLLSNSNMKYLTRRFFPHTRPQDNIILTPDEPAEEEQPLSTFSVHSGLHSFFFPRNKKYFDKYNLFEDTAESEKKGWQEDYKFLVKSISYFNKKKKLVLKNPHNTGRVKELLEIFPNAKFIFLHRNPYKVYNSTMHLFKKIIMSQFLQQYSEDEINDSIILYFKKIVKKYLKNRKLIPKGNCVEISFEELDSNPMKTIEKIYSSLEIDGFESVKENFQEYLNSIKHYKKNEFKNIVQERKTQIETEWKFFFDEFGYKIKKS